MNHPLPPDPPEPTPVPLPIAPPDFAALRARSMRASIWEGAFTVMFMTWTSGAVLTGYLLALGARPIHLAAAASLPLLIQLLAPLATWMASRMRNRILYLQVSTGFGRGLWAIAVFIPWLGLEQPALALIAVLGVASLLQVGAGPVWVSLMGDTVPSDRRGRYFGLRNGIMAVITTTASLSAGYFLDRAPSPGGFQLILAIGLIFAAVGIVLYGQQVDPPRHIVKISFLESVREPLRDRVFLRFLLFSMAWNAAVMIGSPFVIPYFFDQLKMSFTQVAIWSAIAAVCTLFVAPLWGRIADQVGHVTVLKVTSLLVSVVLPLCWLVSAPGFLTFIWISGVIDAFAWGGFNTAAFNMSLVTAPARARMMYLAVLSAATGLTGCLAGMASGPLLELFSRWSFSFSGFTWTGYHHLFVLTMILRTSARFFLRGMPERPARSLMSVLREYTQRGMSLLVQSRTGAS